MGAASELAGVATWRSGMTTDFDEGRFRRENAQQFERYTVMRPTRQFKIRW